jgi:hypothetical protein
VFDNEAGELEQGQEQDRQLVVANGGTMQQVKTGYTTAIAVQQPRALPMVQRRINEEARMMGDAAYYGWAAGKDRIEGPSQALAYACARCWGNCAVDQGGLEETPDAWVFNSTFVDLETGFTLTRKFRQSKRWTVHGKLDAERKDDVRFQIGQTKGDRNVILKALPKWLIDDAMEQAKAGVRKKLQGYIDKHGLPAAIDYACKELAKVGITDQQVCEKFSVAKKAGLTIDNLVVISGDIKAIQSGQEYPDALYPSTDAAEITDRLKNKNAPADEPPPPADDSSDPAIVQEYLDKLAAATTEEEVGNLETHAIGNEALQPAARQRIVEVALARRKALRKPVKGKGQLLE